MEVKDILTLIAATYTIASIIIRCTKTKKDDEVLDKIAPWHEKLFALLEKLLIAKIR